MSFIESLVDTSVVLIQLSGAVTILSIIAFFSWYYLLLKPSIKIYASKHLKGEFILTDEKGEKNSLDKLVLNHCATIRKGFRPCLSLPEGHTQTCYASIYADKKAPKVDYFRETIDYPDGGVASVDWAINPDLVDVISKEELSTKFIETKEQGIIVLIHGLTGGSQESVIKSLALELMAQNFKVLVFNNRGCAGTKVKTSKLYTGRHTHDLSYLFDTVVFKRFPNVLVSAVGCSLGANLLTNYVGEQGLSCRLTSMVSLGNPFSLDYASKLLTGTWMGNKLYGPAMAYALRKLFNRHKQMFENCAIDSKAVLSCKNTYQFDTAGTSALFRYRSADEYYRDGSSVRRIPDIKIPALFLNAHDDPVVPPQCLPIGDIESNPFTVLAVTPVGGHLGWFGDRSYGVTKQKRWHAAAAADFFELTLRIKAVDVQTRYYPSEHDNALIPGPALYRSALIEDPGIEKINSLIQDGQTAILPPA